MLLKDRVAIVTGSSRGIGKATALEFAKQGAKVVVNYRKSKEEAESAVEEIKKLGSDAIAVKADVSKSEDVKRMVDKTLEKFATIDILVNNAGIVLPKEFSELTPEDWRKTLDTNIIGVFLCCQAVAPHMLKQRYGKIVNISSIRALGHCARRGVFDYNVSKAGVVNFTKALAKELAPHINVNSVAPGWIETEMNKKVSKELRKNETEKIYFDRFGKPEEIAKVVTFLVSDEASYVTGQLLVVDGGYSL